VGALLEKKYDRLKLAMEDRLHQPYRKRLIPGFDQVVAGAYNAGAYGAALSGAGPSIFAFAPPSKAQGVGAAMEKGFAKAGKSSRRLILGFDNKGAVVTG
jgi:homoserine kinase